MRAGRASPCAPPFPRGTATSPFAARRWTTCRRACRAAGRRRPDGEGFGAARSWSVARNLLARSHGIVDELRQLHARLDRIVVREVKLRHGVEPEPVRQLAAQKSGRT